MDAKLCTRCKSIKPVTAFNRDAKLKCGLQSKCRDCQKEVRHDWYLRNREREIEKAKQWARDNPVAAREKDRRRAILHPGRTSAASKRWVQEHAERAREFALKWKRANPEKVRVGARAAYAKDPNKSLAKVHRRRVRVETNGGTFTKAEVDRLFLLQRGCCAVCRVELKKRFHRDHIKSLAAGGVNLIRNIQLLCAPCNSRKAAKDPIAFMQEQGFLI